MSTIDTVAYWTPLRLREGIRALWEAAAARPRDGIGPDDVAEILPGYGEDGEWHLLRLALMRQHLLEVSRMEVSKRGRVSSGPRYFAMGARP